MTFSKTRRANETRHSEAKYKAMRLVIEMRLFHVVVK